MAIEFAGYPNPVSDVFNFSYTSTKDQEYQLRLIDMLGKTVIEREVHFIEGYNSGKMDVSGLPSGIYILSLRGVGVQENIRLVIE